jgi:hypothetical protein
MQAVSQRFLILVGSLLILKAGLFVMLFADWRHGILRGVLLTLMLAGLLALKSFRPQAALPGDEKAVSGSLKALLLAAFAVLMVGVGSSTLTVRLGDAHFDIPANVLRSAQYLWRGESPYAAGMLLDPGSYRQRADIRKAAGIGAEFPDDQVMDKGDIFWDTLDPDLRRKLLPAPTNGDPIALREYSILGYKYGPVPLLAVAAVLPVLGPVSVPLIILLCTIVWAWATSSIMQRVGWEKTWATAAACLVLFDPHVAFSILFANAVDIWPMLFGTLGVLALMTGRPVLLGVMLALAVSSKIFPGAIYLPMLLMLRPSRAITAFVVVAVAMHLPWLIWDPRGFYYNVILWPTLMLPDSTSWVFYVSKEVALVIRLALLAAIGCVSLWLIVYGGARRLFWSLAFLNLAVALAGSGIHNNYLPWFSGWYVLALIVYLLAPRTENAEAISASPFGAEATTLAPGKS